MPPARISVIVPVFRETEEALTSIDRWIDEHNSERIEWIIVVAQEDPGIQHTYGECANVVIAPKGRGKQMNAGAAKASGEMLVFLHADTRLDQTWYEELMTVAEGKSSQVWGAFSPRIDSPGLIYRCAEQWGRWRSQMLKIPYGDQAIFISAPLFRMLGGFDEKVDFMEELDLAKRLYRLKISPVILPCRASTSNRRWKTHGAFTYSLRNVFLFVLFMLGIPRSVLRFWY